MKASISMNKMLELLLVLTLSFLGFKSTAQDQAPIDWRLKADNKDATFYEVQAAFYDYWKDKTPSKGQGYSVFKRWEEQMAPRVFPSGDMTLPSTTYQNYMEWLREDEVTSRSMTSNWTSLGPDMVPSGYDAGVGRVDFLHFDPTNSNTLYIGTPDGGLWKSTDGGNSWATNTDFLTVIGCADLAIHPTVTDTMYLATGNWEDDRSSIGVLKSTDGGASWGTTALQWAPSDSYEIRRMVMDPTNPSIMMAITDGGLYRTTDGWDTFTEVLNFSHNLYDIKFRPGDHMTVYASGKQSGTTNIFWKSTDNGVTWTAINLGLPSSADVSRAIIGVTADDNDYVYLLAGNKDSAYKGLYLSTDSGNSFFTQSTSPNILSTNYDGSGTKGQAFHDLAIAVSPIDRDKVTIGGVNSWRSTDNGVTWSLFTYWLGIDNDYPGEGFYVPYVHADIQSINYLPGSSSTMFITADGGVYKSIDDGVSWTDLSNTLVVTQQNVVAQSATTEGLIVTGLQDIGSIMKSGGSWSVISGGDGESAFIDRTNDSTMVVSNPNGAHEISTNMGASFSTITGLPAGNLFYSPVLQDPVSATTMYAGGRSKLYRNTNFVTNSSSWDTLAAPPEFSTGGSIIEFTVAPSDPNVIYVIKGKLGDTTMVSKSIDGGASFMDITGTLPISLQMTNLAVSNTDADKIWVTYSGYSSANKVFRSTNGGTTWENISGGLPNVPMNTIVYVNDSPNDELYLGGDIGIYYYDNTFESFAPGNWIAFNTNLPNTKVKDLSIFYPTGKLRAATYGRGTWESVISLALPVELISFSGKNRDAQNVLNWHTASESNLKSYTIQRSRNGDVYEDIGALIADAPNSFEVKNYDFVDEAPLVGANYYRLKITDLDATYTYSDVIILLTGDKGEAITLFPNPTSGVIELKGLANENVTIRITNTLGEMIQVKTLSGFNRIDVSNFPNGTYFLEINKGKSTIVKQFVKD